jgi:hypothetical protein
MHQRWPAGNEHQAKPDASVATLYDILIWVQPFLDPLSLSQLAATDSAHRLGSTFSNLWLYQPWAPFRRRRWGFGIPSSNRSATHDQPTYHSIIHFVWTFLLPRERKHSTIAFPAWQQYHQLRLQAVTTSLAPLRLQRPPPGSPTKLPELRSTLYACALLRFNFYYGDFIRWLGGEYTNRHRDWETTFQTLKDVCTRPPPYQLAPS